MKILWHTLLLLLIVFHNGEVIADDKQSKGQTEGQTEGQSKGQSKGQTEGQKNESSTVSDEKIKIWIKQLGGKNFRDREQAHKKLTAVGIVAIAALKKAEKHENSEVRSRVKKIILHHIMQWVARHKANVELRKDGYHLSMLVFAEPEKITDDTLNLFLKHQLLNSIQWLDLSDTKITDKTLSQLKNWKSLKNLYIENTAITDAGIAHLKNIATLEEIYLHNTKITDAAVLHLWKMKSLSRIYLWHTNVSDASFTPWEKLADSNLPTLTRLELYDTKITDTTIAQLKRIKSLARLNLSNTKVTDAAVADLMQMKALRYLSLKNTKVSNEAITKLRKALPTCRVVQ